MVNLDINGKIVRGIHLAIFDKDGTLMDLYNYWSQMVGYRVNIAQKIFSFDDKVKANVMYTMGVDTKNNRLRREGPVGLKKREIVMQAMIDSLNESGYNLTHEACFNIFKEADTVSLNHLEEIIRPMDGMRRLIDGLRDKGCRIAIATTDKTERAKLAMKFLGIADSVDLVVGEDMVKNYKPHPDMIDLILKKLSVKRDDAVMVGDAITDVEMGANAKLKASIGVLSGLAGKDELARVTDYVIRDISDIKIV